MLSEEEKTVNLVLQIDAGEDADSDELDRQARMLLREIRDLDIESVELAGIETVPIGAKSAEAVTLGMLAVAVLPTVIPELVKFLQAWSIREENRTVKIKTQVGDRSLEVEYDTKAISEAEIKNLIDTLNKTLVQGSNNKND